MPAKCRHRWQRLRPTAGTRHTRSISVALSPQPVYACPSIWTETTMTNGSQSQPDEIERVACSGCSGFLRLETSVPECVGYPRYDIMRCVSCEFSQWIADENSSAGPIFTGGTNAEPATDEHQLFGFLTIEPNYVVGALNRDCCGSSFDLQSHFGEVALYVTAPRPVTGHSASTWAAGVPRPRTPTYQS